MPEWGTGKGRTVVAIAVAAMLASAAVAQPAMASPGAGTSASVNAEAGPGKVRLQVPTWTVAGRGHETTVRVRYPSGDPRTEWDHQSVKVQARVQGGAWATVGHAKQKPLPRKRGSRTRVAYRMSLRGDVEIRAKAFSTDSAITSTVRAVLATERPAYAPTAIRGTGGRGCAEQTIGRGPSQIAYGCVGEELGYNTWLYNRGADKRELLAPRAAYAEYAVGSNVVIGEKRIYWDEGYWYSRVRRFDRHAGTSEWVGYRRNGKPARTASHSSVSANGNRISYASPNAGISPHAKKGWNVYLARAGTKKSRWIGRGKDGDIAASGRHIVWRTPAGKVRLRNLRTGHITPVTTRPGHDPRNLNVSAGGRFVTFSASIGGERRVRIFDAKTHKLRTIATGGLRPAMSDNGRYITYTGKGGAELYLYNRKTDRKRLVSVGPDGDGSGGYLRRPDISPGGRWILAYTNSINVAPDNGRDVPKNKVILFDRTRR